MNISPEVKPDKDLFGETDGPVLRPLAAPIPARGAQGLWLWRDPPPEILALAEAIEARP